MAKEQISLRIEKEVLDRLDEIAKLADIDRSKLITNILDEGSKTLMQTKKVGLLQFSILMRDMEEKMSEWAKNIRNKNRIDEFEK